MCKGLVIIGAGGHGKVIADIAVECGYSDIVFLDDGVRGSRLGFPVVGPVADAPGLNDGAHLFVLALGNNEVRRTLAQKYDLPWATLVHPSAQIGLGVTMGAGTVVMANAVVNPDAVIGRHAIINTGAVVEHDNVIGDYVHISPRAALAGTVTVGEGTHIGIGVCVRNNIRICGGCTIGAGAVVVKDIEEAGTYVGVPGRKIK